MTQRYSHSMLSLYRTCPLRFRFHYIDHLVPLQPSGRHDLDFGRAWDAALNEIYRGHEDSAEQAFTEAYHPEDYPDPLPLWSQGKSYANGLAAIRAYSDRWTDDDQFWDVLSIQQPEHGEDNDRTLKLDLVVRDRRDGLVY